jgi:Aminotransferase class I and II
MNKNHNNVQAETAPTYRRRLTMETISASVKRMEYAVRGTVVIAADKMASQEGATIIYTNIGNPQSVGQQPLTWPRQVVALANLPRHIGIDHPHVQSMFPSDAIARAREILDATGSVGAYSHSQGVPLLRQDVADFITKRDGGTMKPTKPDDIFLTNGASTAIQMVLTALIAQPERTGISTLETVVDCAVFFVLFLLARHTMNAGICLLLLVGPKKVKSLTLFTTARNNNNNNNTQSSNHSATHSPISYLLGDGRLAQRSESPVLSRRR